MFRAGIYRMYSLDGRREERLIGVVEFESKVYRNWFVEIAGQFCEEDFECGDLLGNRCWVRNLEIKTKKLNEWRTQGYKPCAMGDVCPAGAIDMVWDYFFAHDFTEILCASIYAQETLSIVPRMTIAQALDDYIEVCKGGEK